LRNHTADHATAGKSHDFFFSTAHVKEVGNALLDYSDGNWVGFGYNLIKLVKTLLGTLGQAEIVV